MYILHRVRADGRDRRRRNASVDPAQPRRRRADVRRYPPSQPPPPTSRTHAQSVRVDPFSLTSPPPPRASASSRVYFKDVLNSTTLLFTPLSLEVGPLKSS